MTAAVLIGSFLLSISILFSALLIEKAIAQHRREVENAFYLITRWLDRAGKK